ncbi:hypothetical protein TPA0598_03_07460 [Streptomyces lydicamycinicus]|uniref:Uncharacterized protein n=1 Tax=Streptomyces lydicamycinicus TaxID=1546107 RepID=A0A0P4R5E0_9ACTN|nr:hypothetical protein TPA0598_03_07460 [Streptomyces lydicamycinicus]
MAPPTDGACADGRPTAREWCSRPSPSRSNNADTPGTTLVITTDQPHPSNWLEIQGSTVLPTQVADSIRTALTNGWSPMSPGPPFLLDQSVGFVPSH